MAGGGQIASAYVRILPDLSDFEAQIADTTAQAGDGIARGVQEGADKAAASLAPLGEAATTVGVEAGTSIGDGLAKGMQEGAAKGAASLLEAIPAAAAEADAAVAAAGEEASDSMGGGFFKGKMGLVLGGGLFAGLAEEIGGKLAESAADTAENMLKLQAALGLSASQAQKFAIEADGAGVSTQKLVTMAGRLDKQLASSSAGTAGQAKALDALNISASAFSGANIAQQAQMIEQHISSSNLSAKDLTSTLKTLNIPAAALTSAKSYDDQLAVIKKGLEQAAATGSSFTRMLSQNGIDVQTFKNENFPDQLNTIAEAYEKAKTPAQGLALVQAAFGRAGVQLLPMIQNLATLKQTADSFHMPQINEEQAEQSAMKFKELDAYVQLLAQDLAVKLVPKLTDAASELVKIATPIVEFIKNSGYAQAAVAALAGAFVAMKAANLASEVFGPIITVVQNLLTLLPGVTAEMVGLDAAADANPIGALVVAIGALVAGLVVLYEKVPAVRNVINDAFTDIKTIVNDAVTYVEALWARWGTTITQDAQQTWNTVKQVVSTDIQLVESVISTYVSIIQEVWSRFGESIETVVKTYFSMVYTYISTEIQAVVDVIKIALDLLNGNWSQAWNDFKNLVSTVLSGVVTILKDEITIFTTIAEALGGALLDGIVAGLKKLGTLVLDAVTKGLEGVVKLDQWVVSEGEELGKSLVTGVLNGLGGLAKEVGSGLESSLKGAVSWAGGHLHGSGDFQFTNEAVGAPMAQGIVDGVDKALSTTGAKKISDSVKETMAQALSDNAALVSQSAQLLGKSAMDGVLQGVSGQQQTLTDQVKAALTAAIQPALAEQANSALIKQAGGMIGANAVQAVVDGVVGKQQTLSAQLKTALTQAIQPSLAVEANSALIKTAGNLIGQKAAQSVVDGVVGVQQTVGEQLKTALKAAIAPALAVEAAEPAIHAAASQIGEKAAQAVVDGVVGKSVSLTQQIKTALSTAVKQAAQQAAQTAASSAQSAFSTAFSSLSGAIDSSFEAATQKAVNDMQVTVSGAFDSFQYGGAAGTTSPAEAQLDALQDAHDAAQQQAQLAADQAQQTVDQQSGTAAQILADQQAVAEDQYQIQVSALQKQATLENTAADSQLTDAQNAYEAQRQTLETALNQRITDLSTGLANGNISAKTGMDDLNAILTDPQYGIDANSAAFAMGGQIYTGLNAGLQPVFQLVQTLQDDLAKVNTAAGAIPGAGGSPNLSTSSSTNFVSENGDAAALKQALNDTVVPALAENTKAVKAVTTQVNVTANAYNNPNILAAIR